MNAQVLILFGLAYSLAMLATMSVAAVYIAFLGNYSALFGLGIAVALSAVCGRVYLWTRERA